MADRYWVGGSGNWDASSTANWSASSGGATGASVPTSADNVIFDANSNTGTGAFTVTVTGTSASPAACADFSTGGAGGALDGAMTLSLGATAQLDCYGSMTLPATNLTWSGTSGANLFFRSTTTGKTVTTNGVSIAATQVNFSGSGGEWTLGSALTITTANLVVLNGTFDTSASNYSISCSALVSTGSLAATINLNASAVALSASGSVTFSNTNLTFNAGTSTIACSTASPTFAGNGVTFYNVTFSSTGTGTTTITGANTFNNLTQTSRSATGIRQVVFAVGQTVNGTLTLGAANTSIRRILVYGNTTSGTGVGTPVTLTVATLATLADVDFRDITAAGASGTWSGTRIGNGGGNSNITFTAGGPKYWNLAAGGNWSATAWATSSGGAVNANNFPLAQDTVYIVDTGLTAGNTITMDQNWWLPTIDASARTTAFTLAGTVNLFIFGSLTLPSVATVTNSGTWYFQANNSTQNITTNGVSVAFALNCNGSTNNTVKLLDNFTTTGAVTFQQGTLDLNSKTLTGLTFTSSNSITRTIAFGTGQITVTGNAATIWSMGTLTGFTFTGTSKVVSNYSGSTGTRTLIHGSSLTGTESNAFNFEIIAGTDTVTLNATFYAKNLNFTGFLGALTANTRNIYGNLTLSSGMTLNAGTGVTTFAATSGTQQVTSNGQTMDFPITVNAPGAIVQCQDALTLGSTRTLTMTNGTLQLKAGVTSTVGNFATSGTNQKYLQSTLAGTQATLSDASGTVSVSYLTIQDINATGGAEWQAYVTNNNVDAGDNTGWDFYVEVGRYIYTRRKNKRILL